MTVRYYEDIELGEIYDVGAFSLSKEEILSFAEQYDPLPFHTDEDAAADTMFGGLIASGWQTAANCHRQVSDGFLVETAIEGGRAVENLQFYVPVRPGDQIDVTIKITDKYPSSSSKHGVIEIDITAQRDGDTVAEMTILPLVQKRDP